MVALGLISLTPGSVLMQPELRWAFSIKNYLAFGDDGDFFRPFLVSLATVALAVLGTVALAWPWDTWREGGGTG